MAVDDIVGVQIHGQYQDQNIVNTMHYRISAQVSDDNEILQVLTDAWEFVNAVAWLARHIDTYTLMGLKGFSLSGANKVPGITHIADPGVVTGTEVPSPVCRVITLYTDSSNYRRRGRLMLSGTEILQIEDSDGSVKIAERTLLDALAEVLTTDIEVAGDSFVAGLAPTIVLPFEPFTGHRARKTPALIRSRRVRTFGIG